MEKIQFKPDKTFVTVNSARITPERFEQELFGEEADGKLVAQGQVRLQNVSQTDF